MTNLNWINSEMPENRLIEHIQKSINVNRIVATLLCQRGIFDYESAKKFFRPTINNLYDPFLFRDMKKAVERIELAISKNEKIMIYGDYDVDGTTAVAVTYSFLKNFTENIEFYIPDRYTEGYGVSQAGVDFAIKNSFKLVIALDCGIRSEKLVEFAKNNGVDFVICDHHIPGEILPPAIALLDAKVPGETYPFKELSGCGVAFKLVSAFCINRNLPEENYLKYIDLVAVSTCCDIVPIVDENRILVKAGTEKLNTNPSPGLKVLKESCINKKELVTSDIVFYIGPRINAVGRLKHAKDAVKLLIVEKEEDAVEYAEILNKTNNERKNIDESITLQALEMIMNDKNHIHKFSNVLYNPQWHKGVVGIVASRIIEHHYRPTIILTGADGKITGSARSIEGFDIHDALTECSDLLLQYGGHSHAAGLSLLHSNYEKFAEKFDEISSKKLTREMLTESIKFDIEVKPNEITESLVKIIKQMEPFGPGNMSPVFYISEIKDTGMAKQMGGDSSHLSLNIVLPKYDKPLKGIGFKLGNKYDKIKSGKPFEALFSLSEEEFNGYKFTQLFIKDIK